MNKVDYSNSITNLSNSILKRFNAKPFHSTIPEIDTLLLNKKKIIVFLFDGMGKHILEKHLDKDSFFRSHIVHNIWSTTPPTTVASTTSFLSAKYPIETGWLGWTLYFENRNQLINVFPNVDDVTGEHIPGSNIMETEYPYTNIAKLINTANNMEIARIIYGHPVDKNNKKVRKLKSFVKYSLKETDKLEESFTYAYWIAPDCYMHKYGTEHKIVHKNILNIQKYIKRYSKRYPDIGILIIADHGMMDVDFHDITDHQDIIDCLKMPLSIEKRCANFFCKEGRISDFKELFNKYYGEHYELLTINDALNMKIFGDEQPNKKVKKLLGDYIALAKDNYSIQFPSNKKGKIPFKGHHAGNTLDELEISVIGINF